MESLTASKSWRPRKKTTSNKLKQPSRVSGDGPKNYMPDKQTTRCESWGHHQKHNRQTCPAKDARCHKCSKQGHFAKCCRAKSRVNVVSEVETSVSDSEVFLGEVSANEHKPWTADIIVNQDCVTFKLDSSADVTVIPAIPASTYNKLTDKPLLCKTQKKLYGPCRYELRCLGEFQAMLKYGPKSWKATSCVLDDLNRPLLRRIACQKLGVVAEVDEIASPERSPGHMKRTHPNVFTGLGCMPGEYEIKLREGETPFNLTTPHRIPIPLLPNVQAELKRMEDIEKVDKPTEWCSPVVVVPKKNGKVRICGDFIQLKKAVLREKHPMLTTEQTLAKLAGTKIVSKLDANSGFWQRKLSLNSKLLTTFITSWGRYCYRRLPFGISSAPEHYQKIMQKILAWT